MQQSNQHETMKAIIETERLYLREILPEDVQAMFEMDSDPDVHRFLGRTPINSMEEAATQIENIRQQYIDNGVGRIAIIEKTSNEFVGWGGLKLQAIYAIADLEHAASRNVLEKSGFVFVNTFEYDGDPHAWYILERAAFQPPVLNDNKYY